MKTTNTKIDVTKISICGRVPVSLESLVDKVITAKLTEVKTDTFTGKGQIDYLVLKITVEDENQRPIELPEIYLANSKIGVDERSEKILRTLLSEQFNFGSWNADLVEELKSHVHKVEEGKKDVRENITFMITKNDKGYYNCHFDRYHLENEGSL